MKSYILPKQDTEDGIPLYPLAPSGKHIRAIPEEWTTTFGKQFYIHEQSLSALDSQSESEWMLRLEGQFYETGKKISVTGFDELRRYIRQELNGVSLQEDNHG